MKYMPGSFAKFVSELKLEPSVEYSGIKLILGSLSFKLPFQKASRPTGVITTSETQSGTPINVSRPSVIFGSKSFSIVEPSGNFSYELPEGIEINTCEFSDEVATAIEEAPASAKIDFGLLSLDTENEISHGNYKLRSKSANDQEIAEIYTYLTANSISISKMRQSDFCLISVSHANLPSKLYFLAPPLERIIKAPKERALRIERSIEGLDTEIKNYILTWPPEKLGDGSFGTVYKIHDTSKPPVPFAIKILYNRQFYTSTTTGAGSSGASASEAAMLSAADAKSLAQFRFEYESQIADVLREFFPRLDLVGDVGDYVCPRDYTSEFQSSTACKALRQIFDEQGRDFNLSNYAIIMDYCDFTLKDLLEKIWFVFKDEDGDIKIVSEETKLYQGRKQLHLLGYNLLGKLPYEARIRVSLPFVIGLSQGLSLVHATGHSHHDLKPANIFIKVGYGDFRVKLGDFSFAAPAIQRGTNVTYLKDAISTGTVHFRSPEQRDVADTCEGIVMHSIPDFDEKLYEYKIQDPQNNYMPDDPKRKAIAKIKEMQTKGSVFFVRIYDPKFSASDIKPNDVVVFPSESTGPVRKVLAVISFEFFTDIWLDLNLEKIGSEKYSQFERLVRRFPDREKTQVVIYRLPGRRSDLFGVGAILFDLITGGESPETFYEKLRTVDIPASKGHDRSISVASILKQYQIFASSETRPGATSNLEQVALWNMFVVFENDVGGVRRCAPDWLVQIILQCMMCHAEDNLEGEYVKILLSKSAEQIRRERIFSPIDVLVKALTQKSQQLQADLMLDNLLISPHLSREWHDILLPEMTKDLADPAVVNDGADKSPQLDTPQGTLAAMLLKKVRSTLNI